jgi:chemotaxis protein MotA
MLAFAGIVVVLMAVFGGYLLEKGNLYLLFQPAEMLIVAGATVGIALVANPPRMIRKMIGGIWHVLRAPAVTPKVLLDYLLLLYEVFAYAQRAGVMRLEDDVENPDSSRIFSNHPRFLKDPIARAFLCDSLRMMIIGATSPAELDHLMDLDIDVQRRGEHEPVGALHNIAEALPGLGIVAAVLGVVITMGSIGGAPETIGEKVAAALVGTFLGILLCYGVVTPFASRLESISEERTQFLQIVKTAVAAFARGASPILAVEYARRSIQVELRPDFGDFETTVRRDARIPAVPEAAGGKGAVGAAA